MYYYLFVSDDLDTLISYEYARFFLSLLHNTHKNRCHGNILQQHCLCYLNLSFDDTETHTHLYTLRVCVCAMRMEKLAAYKSRLGVAVCVVCVRVYICKYFMEEKKLYFIVNINNNISSRDNMKCIPFCVNNRMIFVTPSKSLYGAYVKYSSAIDATAAVVVDCTELLTLLFYTSNGSDNEQNKEKTKGHFAHHLSSNES